MKKKIRYVVVGLGHIAQTAVLPAFAHSENSELAALVTGPPDKNRQLSARYGVNAYHYDDLERAFEKERIDAAYIATPNSLHPEHCGTDGRSRVVRKTNGSHGERLRSNDSGGRREQCEIDDSVSSPF